MPIARENTLHFKLSSMPVGRMLFLSDLADYDTAFACRTLARKCREGEFVKLSSGLYFKPRMTKFGPYTPSTDEIIKVIAQRDNIQVMPTGMYALNALGFSTQVPMRVVYLTSGSSRVIKVNGVTVKLKRAVPKNFAFKSGFYALLYQALRAIGEKNIEEDEIDHLHSLLNRFPDPEAFDHDLKLMPLWMRKIIRGLNRGSV